MLELEQLANYKAELHQSCDFVVLDTIKFLEMQCNVNCLANYQLFNVIWLPFFKIKKFRGTILENKKVQGDFLFMFFDRMKFISKSVWCLVMENVALSVPHLRNIIFKIYIQNDIQRIISWKMVGLPFDDFRFFILRYGEILFPKMFPYTF